MCEKLKTIVIGSGILEASHAYTLANSRHIHCFESSQGPAQNHGTGASSACIRRHYSHVELAVLSSYGFHFLNQLQNNHPEYHFFRQTGCLSIAPPENLFQNIYLKTFEDCKINYSVYNNIELSNQYQDLLLNSDETGIYDQFAGYADPQVATRLLTNLAIKKGAEFHYNTKIAQIIHDGKKLTGVQTASGETIYADEVIIAASYCSEQLLQKSNINFTLPATSKRPVFTTYVPLKTGKFQGPIFADFSNDIYCKPEGAGILVGSIAPQDEEQQIGTNENDFLIDDERLLSLFERIQNRFKRPVINRE